MNISVKALWNKYKTQIIVGAFLAILWIVFTIHSPELYLSTFIYSNMFNYLPYQILLAVALTLIVIEGEIDLSFPSTMGLSAFVFVETLLSVNSPIVAFVAAMIVGMIVGVINGRVITKFNLNSMMWTLGMYFALRGLTILLSEGKIIPILFMKGTLSCQAFVGDLFGVPVKILWAIAIVLWVLLNRHRFGASMYLVGDNEDVAVRLGVNADKVKIITYIIMGACAAIVGVAISLGVGQFFPLLGKGYLLMTLAAVFIGGNPIEGGYGTLFGTLLGVFIIGFIKSGIITLGFGGFARNLFFGALIVVSLIGHRYT